MQTPKGVLERGEGFPGLAQWERFITAIKAQRERTGQEGQRCGLPMISVIIPAHNEEHYLRRTLDAVNRQAYSRFEVIVVANGCTDKTVGVACYHCHRLLVEPQKGLGRARNLGADAAAGELLVFLDADTVLEPNALATIAEEFTPGHAAGTLKGMPDQPRWVYRGLYGLKNLVHRWSIHQGSAGVILCWKNDFEAAGGFDETLQVMEISELIKRLRPWGKYRFIGKTAAITSMRRYERTGAWRTAALWIKLWVESWFTDLRYKRYETVR